MPSQPVAVELFYDGAWHDLVPAEDVFAEPIKIMRGDSDDIAAPRPASVEVQLANDDDMYRTSNPESPLYGKAGVNTPLRVSMPGGVRGHVEASSFAAGQDLAFRRNPRRGRAWVDVEGGGILQRINEWTEPLKSPFRQFNETLDHVIGYWPAEQLAGSTQLLSTVPQTSSSPAGTTGGSRPGPFVGMAFDSQHRPPSSGPLMDFDSSNAEVGPYFSSGIRSAFTTGPSTTSGWQLSWVARYEPLAAGDQFVMTWANIEQDQFTLTLNPTTGNINIFGSSGEGATLFDHTVSYSGWDWTQWTLISVDFQYDAGTVDVWVNWRNATNTAGGFSTTSYSGVPGRLDWWNASIFGGVSQGSTIGHIMGTDVSSAGGTDLFDADRRYAWSGYLGETAAARFARLCTLKGIPYTILGDAADSHPMGPQGPGTLAEQFQEIRTTEDGLIFDDVDALGLVFMLRNYRYNQTPALVLNAAGSDHGMPALPVEVTDGIPIHNVVTASQRDGGEYTATDATSPMGTQDPPDGRGEYKQRRDVNVADEDTQLPQQANWWLRRGTVNLPRYPTVTVNLAAVDAATLAQVEAVDVGSVIEITNFREYTVRLHVLGYVEIIGTSDASRAIAFTCQPDQQFQVGVYDGDDAYTPRYDLATCTTNAAYGPTATTLVLDITSDDEEWSQTSAYDLLISGELIGVPVGGMGAKSLGQQTLTGAVRSKNGVRKTLPSGSPVRVATPGRWAI